MPLSQQTLDLAEGSKAEPPPRYGEVFRRALQKARFFLEQDPQSLEILKIRLQLLLEIPPKGRPKYLLENPILLDHRVVRALLEASQDQRDENPTESEELARLALGLAERIHPDRLPSFMSFDLRCRAWVAIANAQLLQEDPKAACHTLQSAELLLPGGTGDPKVLARVLTAKAALFRARGENELAARASFEAHQAKRRVTRQGS